MNSGGIIQSASDSVLDIFGWTPHELFGHNVKVLIPEPKRSALDRYLDRYRQGDSTKVLHRSKRFDGLRKDGQVIQIELSMSRADLPTHATPYFIGIIRDVSRQIDTGADSPAERTRLQHFITEQTRALATANLRLQLADRLASLGTLAAGLGHDMNNVLLPVRARLNALEHAGITTTALGHVTAVRRSIAYLQHLSDGLHFLALDPEGRGSVRGSENVTDLAVWWQQVGTLLCKAVPRHVKFVVSLPASLPPVNIAPHWLTQAVLNIVVNAGEAMPKGSRLPLIRITANVTDRGHMVELSIADNGRGMSADVRRRAFDLFFTTKARGMGTGLGLPLVRKVALRAGGKVELESTVAKGTAVTLSLPVPPGRPAVTNGTRPHATTAALAVQDDRTAALLSQILASAHIRIIDGPPDSPGTADLWITDPTRGALTKAERWYKKDRSRRAVLIGPPVRALRKKWAALSAAVIDPPDDFEAMRHVLGDAATARPQNTTRKGTA